MPQLKLKQPANERGSVLVAVIAFAIIISIAAGGLLMLAANSVGNETDELDDYQALLAAESGLQAGLRWLGDTLKWRTANNAADSTHIPMNDINGMTTKVFTTRGSGRLVLSSHAVNGRMNYIKEVACNVDSSNDVGFATNSWDPGRPNLDNIWFDGPVRANAPLQMAIATYPPPGKRSNVYFLNGPVSVTDMWIGTLNNCIGPSGNDYTYGIDINTLTRNSRQAKELDKYFDNTFEFTRDSVRMPGMNLATIPKLPQHYFSYGPGGWNWRPTIYFYLDDATQQGKCNYYYNASPTGTDIRQVSFTIGSGQIFYVPQASVSVLGTLNGHATVVTDPDSNIFPIGDILYKQLNNNGIDFDSYDFQNNHGIGYASSDFLALVAGGDIVFDKWSWYMHNRATGEIRPFPNYQTMFLTSSLIAANSIKFASPTLTDYNYSLRAIGNRVLNQFINYPAIFGPAAHDRFRFYYDRRLSNNLSAPGVPAFRRIIPDPIHPTGPGIELYFLKTTNWRETNLPRP